MREALERLKASSMISSSIRFSLTGGPVGCTTKTSAPRTLSWIWNQISPSLKRERCARPTGRPRCEAIASPRAGWALPVKILNSLPMAPSSSGQRRRSAAPRQSPVAPLRPRQPARVAGAEGFEPSNTGFKAPRLDRLATPQRTTRPPGRGPARILRVVRSGGPPAFGPSPGASGRARLRRRGGGAASRRTAALGHLLLVDGQDLFLQILAHL